MDAIRPPASIRILLGVALGLAIAAAAAVLVLTLDRPLIDDHGFRQTQTAISVYWMLHGGPWLDYWTPVLGAPWITPFEFPLYQWIVAALVKLFGVPIDAAGRLVSFAWLLIAIPPGNYLLAAYGQPRAARAVFPALLLACPVYLFWGRAFLIETQALALCMAQLALFHRWLTVRRSRDLLFALGCGLAGALTKTTTLPPFLLLSGLMLLPLLWRDRAGPSALWRPVGGWLLAYALPVALSSLWTHHADIVKAASPIAITMQLGQPRMVAWNFGTLDQRLSIGLVITIIHSINDTLGQIGKLAMAAMLFHLLAHRDEWRTPNYQAIVACLLGYFVPFAIFTNLHVAHSYYRASNAILLVAAVSLMLGRFGAGRTRLATIAALAVIVSQLAFFASKDFKFIRHPEGLADYRLGLDLKRLTPPDSILLIYGLDWSPIAPYYAERRAIMESAITPLADVRARTHDMTPLLDGHPLGAIVRCPYGIATNPVLATDLDRMTAGMRSVASGRCAIYLPA